MSESQQPTRDKLVNAYNTMLKRVKGTLDEAEKDALPTLERNIASAKEKATDLGELSREEAERIGEYLRRDVQDAGQFMADSGTVIRDWLRFDLGLVEDRLLEAFGSVADQTRVELEQLADQALAVGEWHTGEVVGIGTLRCTSCGENLHFHQTGRIPPCPACRGTAFRRISYSDEPG